jgi:hypothetical protein
VVTITGKTGTSGLNVNASYIYAAQGFNSDSTATNAVNITGGGVDVKYLLARESLTWVALSSSPSAAPSGCLRMYADSSAFTGYTGALEYSYNGGTYIKLFAMSGSQAGYLICPGISIGTGPVTAGSFNIWDGSSFFSGVSGTLVGTFTWNGSPATTIVVKGGAVVQVT